jgi:spectinomycin phosphotransferase
MIEKQPLLDQCIIDCLNTNYGIKVTTLTFLPLGADINALVYKAKTTEQLAYFVKLKRGHHHDISPVITTLKQFIAQFERQGVVEIAFKTSHISNKNQV